MTALTHSWYMTVRHLRALQRQPWWIAITLIQPIIYLVLYGQLFQRVVDLPGFQATNYVSYVTPGVVIMMALFGGGWNGMGIILEMDNGVMDRFLVSPVSRVAIVAGRLIQMSILVVLQASLLLGLGLLMGARFDGGAVGLLVLLVSAVLVAVPFGALSNAMALVIRRQQLHPAADDVPLAGVHGDLADAPMDSCGRPLQPGRVERRGGTQRDVHLARLAGHRDAYHLARRALGLQRDGGDAGVSLLSAVRIERKALVLTQIESRVEHAGPSVKIPACA